MEFIKVEEFLKQPVEVQKVFLDWWKKNATEFDLLGYIGESKAYQNSFPSLIRNVAVDCFELNVEIIPLFTEGQLRQFIEDKVNCKIFYIYNSDKTITVYKGYFLGGEYNAENIGYYNEPTLLQDYWEVALNVARECKANE